MRTILMILIALTFWHCGEIEEKSLIETFPTSTKFVSDTATRAGVNGVWLRKEYVNQLLKEKNPAEVLNRYQDFLAIRIFKYDNDYYSYHSEVKYYGQEKADSIFDALDAEFAQKPEMEIEILNQKHSLENPIYGVFNKDSLTSKGYNLRISEYCNSLKEDSMNQFSKFTPKKGFECLLLRKDTTYSQEKYFLRFHENELVITFHNDSMLEYTFVNVDKQLEMGNVGYAYNAIPSSLYAYTVVGRYHLYNAKNELVKTNIILNEEEKILYWEGYQSFYIKLGWTEGLANIMRLKLSKPTKEKLHDEYIFEREGDIIKLYYAKSERFERFLQHYKGDFAYELRPAPINPDIVPF